MTKEKIRDLLNNAIECLKSCAGDEYRFASNTNNVTVACFAKGKAAGYGKAVELLDFIVDQISRG